MQTSKDPLEPPFITISASNHFEGTSWATIDMPQKELRERLRAGETLQEIVESVFYNPDYSEVDESDNDPYTGSEMKIEKVFGVGKIVG